MMEKYRGYSIHYDPPPIPIRTCDWQWFHEDYDGAPEYLYDLPSDPRCGYAGSLEECKADIDEFIEELAAEESFNKRPETE